jgi:hypothetical protein
MTTKRNGKHFMFPCLQEKDGEGSNRKTTGRILSPLNTSKNKKPYSSKGAYMNPLKITEPIDSTDSEEFQEEVNRMIKSLSESYEVVDIKYSTHVFNGCKKGYSAIVLYR